MKPEILYIENKTLGHSGEAWIGLGDFSKSGQTVYFNDKAFKKLKITGISGNHFDIETGEEYWISKIKKSGKDRHIHGSGIILIDENCVEQYKSFVDFADFRNLKLPRSLQLTNCVFQNLRTRSQMRVRKYYNPNIGIKIVKLTAE